MPYVRDDHETPLCVGRDAQSSRSDLGGMKTEIFLQRGLDTPVNKPPDGQISGLQREQIPLVSRTPCSVLHAAPQSRGTPDQQRTTPQMRAEDARKRAAQHPGNDENRQDRTKPRDGKKGKFSQVMQRPG